MSSHLYDPVDHDALRAAYLEVAAPPSGPDPVLEGIMEGFPPPADKRVGRHNWLTYPYSTWAFRNVSKLFPTEAIRREGAAPAPSRHTPWPLEDLAFDSVCGLRVTLDMHLRASQTCGLLVIRNGAVVFERTYHGLQVGDRHAWFSVSQVLVGLIVEELIYRGALSHDTQVAQLIPDLAGTAYATASVGHLLDMTVGVDYREDYTDPTSHASHYTYASGLIRPADGQVCAQSLHSYLLSLRQNRAHGGFFQYVTANSEVLGWVAEVVTGLAFPRLVQRLWRSLGCEDDGLYITDAWGRGITGAGVCSTLSDLGRVGLLLANKGRLDNRQVLPAKLFERILGSAEPAYLRDNCDYSHWLPGGAYKSQFYVLDNRALMGSGIHGQYLYADTRTQTVIVKFSAAREAAGLLDIDTVRLLRLIADLQVV